jgi:hypothetical protein
MVPCATAGHSLNRGRRALVALEIDQIEPAVRLVDGMEILIISVLKYDNWAKYSKLGPRAQP